MSNDQSIPAAERGHLRLFAVNLSMETLADMDTTDPETLGTLLGIDDLDPTYVELVQISDLEDLGLVGYLQDGYGLTADQLADDRTRLRGLSGYVLIVLSLAFRDRALTLPTRPDVTLIGNYHKDGPDWSSPEPIHTASADTYSGPQPRKKPSDAAMGGRVATFALLFLFIFTAVFIWIAA